MDKLYITHYFYPGTDPWKNIMILPEEEAFRKAEEQALDEADEFARNNRERMTHEEVFGQLRSQLNG